MQEHMIRSRVFCSWDLKPRRKLRDWEIEEMRIMMDILEKYLVGDQDWEDAMIWSHDEDGRFSVSSMVDALSP